MVEQTWGLMNGKIYVGGADGPSMKYAVPPAILVPEAGTAPVGPYSGPAAPALLVDVTTMAPATMTTPSVRIFVVRSLSRHPGEPASRPGVALAALKNLIHCAFRERLTCL
jgi:hypothetical protein